MFERFISSTLLHVSRSFPAILLTGPRQSGKTTLLKHLFPNYAYVNLEAPDTLLRIQSDPRDFLSSPETNWIIDEAQHFPLLFSYLQETIDSTPSAGRFILSGSQNFLLNKNISQSLAGRVAVMELLPLSYAEYLTYPGRNPLTLWQFLYSGSYPRVYQEHLDHWIWYNSYIRTYVERDVRDVLRIRDLGQFQLFLKLCAGRHGQLLNLSALAAECGISHTAATHWLTILEASYLIFLLRPHFTNFNKRLVKSPKLYFYDSAIACHLLGIESASHLQIHAQRGAIFEGFILTELLKQYTNRGRVAPLYFWRDHLGLEIDALIEFQDQLIAIEIKATTTFHPDLLSGLKKWQKIAKNKVKRAVLIYGGTESFMYEGIEIVAWNQIDGHFST